MITIKWVPNSYYSRKLEIDKIICRNCCVARNWTDYYNVIFILAKSRLYPEVLLQLLACPNCCNFILCQLDEKKKGNVCLLTSTQSKQIQYFRTRIKGKSWWLLQALNSWLKFLPCSIFIIVINELKGIVWKCFITFLLGECTTSSGE